MKSSEHLQLVLFGIKSHKNIHILKTTVEDLVKAFIRAYVAVNPK